VNGLVTSDHSAAHPAFDPDVSKWDAWHPREVTRLLAGVDVPWYVAAGWGIDLVLGGNHRRHEDLEIAVPSERFAEIAAALDGLEICVIGPEAATARPLGHAAHFLADTHQTWIREPATGLWRLDIFREPSRGDTWICRRDESIRLPFDEVIAHTSDGIPYGRPEVILLYKAKHARPKDNEDFAAVLPLLERERQRWLASALELVHPDHPWLGKLSA